MSQLNKISPTGINLIKSFEGCSLKSYLCPAKIPTIGFGNTTYLDGTKVKLGNTITQEQADDLLLAILMGFQTDLNKCLTADINQNQYDSLMSLIYNIGPTNLRKSTLLKLINENPNNPLIETEFKRWNKASGVVLAGLKRRRESEWLLYSK